MMISKITEEKDEEEASCFIDREAQKEKIRKIIEYQKTLYWSSCSSSSLSSSAASASSSFCSSRGSRSLLDLMKVGSTSLRRLFDMEHTSLATHFEDYSGSPITKSVPLWGSDTDDEIYGDPWASIKQIGSVRGERSRFASDGSFIDQEFGFKADKQAVATSKRKLKRKKSFQRLPRFLLWRCRGFIRFRFRVKRLRIIICGKIF